MSPLEPPAPPSAVDAKRLPEEVSADAPEMSCTLPPVGPTAPPPASTTCPASPSVWFTARLSPPYRNTLPPEPARRAPVGGVAPPLRPRPPASTTSPPTV
eukprot:4037582-Pyramimonas_sp.AAC.1